MLSTNEYKELIEYSDNLIKSASKNVKNISQYITGVDLVHDALVEYVDDIFDMNIFISKIKGIFIKYCNYSNGQISHSFNDFIEHSQDHKISNKVKSLSCNKCQQEKPASNFRLRFDKRINLNYVNSICRDCELKNGNEYYLKNGNNECFKIKNRSKALAYHYRFHEIVLLKKRTYNLKPESKAIRKEWQNQNTDRIKEKARIINRKWASTQREMLSDNYIKNLLISHSKLKTKDLTQEMIFKKREEIQNIRFRKGISF